MKLLIIIICLSLSSCASLNGEKEMREIVQHQMIEDIYKLEMNKYISELARCKQSIAVADIEMEKLLDQLRDLSVDNNILLIEIKRYEIMFHEFLNTEVYIRAMKRKTIK